MKYLLVLCCLLCSATLFATVHTVDNSANSTADFKDLQTAIDAAEEGDTLLIKGSYIPYGESVGEFSTSTIIELDKRLVLIGQGAYGHPTESPSIDDRFRRTYLGRFLMGEDAAGSRLSGVWINSVVAGKIDNQAEAISDIQFSECYINYFTTGDHGDAMDGLKVVRSTFILPFFEDLKSLTNLKITNSLIVFGFPEGARLGAGDNLISNSIVTIHINGGTSSIYDQDANGNDLYEQPWDVENLRFQNSVLYLRPNSSERDSERLVFRSSNSELENCIIMGPFVSENLLESNNVTPLISNLSIDVRPFVQIPPSEGFQANIIRTATFIGNYRLKSGSVGENNGTDGTNVGIYGGEFPWVDGPVWRYDNEPSLPTIESLELEKKTLKPGEGLKVRVRARAKGNQ